MSSSVDFLQDEKFWSLVKELLFLSEDTPIKTIATQYNLPELEVVKVCQFMFEMGCDYDLKQINSTHIVPKLKHMPTFKVEFNLYEWMLMQSSFPLLSGLKPSNYLSDLTSYLAKLEGQCSSADLFKHLELLTSLKLKPDNVLAFNKLIKTEENSLVSQLERICLKHQLIKLQMHNQQEINIIGFKLAYLDHELCLFGEELDQGCLVHINISEIDNITEFDEENEVHFKHSSLELNSFVDELREISSSSIRLILKIYAVEQVNLAPEKLHLASPCMVTNGKGDKIWAAYVEPCEELFKWIFDHSMYLEILEPLSIKKAYLEYCEDCLKKLSA